MLVRFAGASIVAVEAEPKASVREHVEECIKHRKCVICGDPEYSRGLCSSHHRHFENERDLLPEDEQSQFEIDLMRNGMLVKRRGGRPAKKSNPFRKRK